MAKELVYTSSEQGLVTGASGFCTVLQTQDIGKVLVNRLESLCVYAHLFTPTPDGRNPVAFSHLIVRAGTDSHSVLSRISDYKLDYSGRTNFLAHHVVLENSERSVAGPAWLLAQPGMMLTRWDGPPRHAAQKHIPTGVRWSAFCPAWKAAAGDAAWAGVLTDWFVDDPRRATYIIYDPNLSVLPLVVEALALVPADMRWQVTFSTFYGKHLSSLACNWRFAPIGSEEAAEAKRPRDARVIDLTRPLPAPPKSQRTEQAAGIAAPASKVARVLFPAVTVAALPGKRVPSPDADSPNKFLSAAPSISSIAPPQPAPVRIGAVAPPPARKLTGKEADLIRGVRGDPIHGDGYHPPRSKRILQIVLLVMFFLLVTAGLTGAVIMLALRASTRLNDHLDATDDPTSEAIQSTAVSKSAPKSQTGQEANTNSANTRPAPLEKRPHARHSSESKTE
ncbi:MAG: hypothetical protein WD648_16395 [Planctomycetaceae bacterium]